MAASRAVSSSWIWPRLSPLTRASCSLASVEFVVVELELCLGCVEVVGVGDGAVGLLQGCGERVDVGLVFLDEGLKLLDPLLGGESVAGEGVARREAWRRAKAKA